MKIKTTDKEGIPKFEFMGWAEVKVLDDGSKVWKAWMIGQEGVAITKDPVKVDCNHFPAGTRISMVEPCCPRCEERMEICNLSDCDYDWPTDKYLVEEK